MEGYRLRLRQASASLTASEHRVADVLSRSPESVGFGTVSEVAAAAECGVATVVRLAVKLGYRGFSDLQADVRTDLASQLRPAAERIRDAPSADQPTSDLLVDHLELEIENLRQMFAAVEADRVDRIAAVLADPARTVALLSGDAGASAVGALATMLDSLRGNVVVLDANPVAVGRRLALLPPRSVVVVCDVRRYDAWVVDLTRQARADGHTVVALTDSDLSPLAPEAAEVILVTAAAIGPFDSATALVSLVHLLVAATARRLPTTAPERLRRIEDAWHRSDAMIDDQSPPTARSQP